MAITATNSTTLAAPFSLGDGLKAQLMTYRALTGSTSGTVTADGLKTIAMILTDGLIKNSAAPTYSGNVATLAFVVPAETAATLTKGGVTYTAVADLGQDGNAITVAYTAGGTAGAEVVTVTGNAISIQIQSGTSTITQVRTAANASAACAALVTATGTSATVVTSATASALTGGVSGGCRGSLICLGQ